MENCDICRRINEIKSGISTHFVKEMKTGYVVLGDFQYFKGYCMFLSKEHVSELHEMEEDFYREFMKEYRILCKAVFQAFQPRKLNYECLGNVCPHVHFHVIPRYEDDPISKNAIWVGESLGCFSDKARPGDEEIQEFKKKLLQYL
jgi:diadenosine tetraphosphate (Ap4A) HIT family hydrolase